MRQDMTKLPSHFIELVQDALLKSFWRKPALKNFLRRNGISEAALAQLDSNESKRVWLDRLFPRIEASPKGEAVIQQMAASLADQSSFPDLMNWEDAELKVRQAKDAVEELKAYLDRKKQEQIDEGEAARNRKLGEERRERHLRSKHDLEKLKARLDELGARIGTAQAGYDFQTWFYDLTDYSEIENRRPYKTPTGRQIDGSITLDGFTYLVELKFTAGQATPTDIDSVTKKVNNNADNTMGIVVSMAGFNRGAITEASGSRSPLLLLDHAHLYLVLGGGMSFADVVRRVRRHSSQEGQAYLAVNDFGG